MELDDLRWTYYEEIGYSSERAAEFQQRHDIEGLTNYWKPFELYSVERMLEDYPADHVLALGGGQSVYAGEDDLRLATEALATSRVVLLLPTRETEAAVGILLSRVRAATPDLPDHLVPDVESMLRQQFLSESNHSLANHVVYSAGLSADEIVQAVVAQLK